MKIAALLTCYNRKEKTLACLKNLKDQVDLPAPIEVFLVADGCTDGTVEAVADEYPTVTLLVGDGSLFWNRGMHLAFNAAINKGFDYYIWINDDTMIDVDAVTRLLQCAADVKRQDGLGIVVGSILDPTTRGLTYGGVSRPIFWKRTHFKRVQPDPKRPLPCETMNGNLVLIPAEVVAAIGNLDMAFPHSMGDFDYGLRAKQQGFSVWVAPGHHGFCSRNLVKGSFEDRALPLHVRWKAITSIKGLPAKAWAHFVRRHAQPFWPIFWLWPYARVVLSALRRTVRS
jgi:GT2 family glycosyltransferase